MDRRDFLHATAAGLTLSAAGNFHVAGAEEKPKRVGLIGCGWYGKCDLLRLIQVAPVEVVSLCDVDKQMLAEAADMVAARQASKKKPRTFADYREMLKEKDLDIVLDRHARPLARPADDRRRRGRAPMSMCRSRSAWTSSRARRCSPPPASTSASCRSARSAAARRTSSRPATASSRKASSARSAWSRSTATTTCAPRENPPDTAPPEYLDYEMWTGPAPMRPYNALVHPRRWRAFMEYGNGIVGDMCIHMLDMVRWMLDLGWPKRDRSTGGILVDKNSKANITDTQTATFDFGDLHVVWQHRTWGDAARSEVSLGRDLLRRQGHAKVSVNSYDFTPHRQGQADPPRRDV